MQIHDFLVEHARFPFPNADELRTVGCTDISTIEAGLLEHEWKALRAVRDNNLDQKLCQSLKDILGDIPLNAGGEKYLLERFSPQLQVDSRGIEDDDWNVNSSEAQVSFQTNFRSLFTTEKVAWSSTQSRKLLDKAFFEDARKFLGEFGSYSFRTAHEHSVKGGRLTILH